MRTWLQVAPRHLWIPVAGCILFAWLLLHGPQFGNLGNRIVLDMRSSSERIRTPVVPGPSMRLVLPQDSINFHPDLLTHPVCLGVELHTNKGATGRLLVKVVAEGAPLAETRLEAHEIVEGNNRVCLKLPLARLQRSGVAVEMASDPESPAQGIELVMHRIGKEPGDVQVPSVRVEVQAPWRVMQIISALMVWAVCLSVLAVVLSAIWREDQQVK